MAHGDVREWKWRGNRRLEWVASTLHTASEHGVSSITTADAHTSAASSRPNWRHRWFKCTRPYSRKTKSGFCACAITFQLASTNIWRPWHGTWSTKFDLVGGRNTWLLTPPARTFQRPHCDSRENVHVFIMNLGINSYYFVSFLEVLTHRLKYY